LVPRFTRDSGSADVSGAVAAGCTLLGEQPARTAAVMAENRGIKHLE
jgi:hypothetical protein